MSSNHISEEKNTFSRVGLSRLTSKDSINSTTSEKVSLMTAKEQSSVVQPLLTDLYQISMAYAYWKNKRHNDKAVFDLYFRKNPFGGEYTIFAGLEECLKFIREYKFHPTDIDYLRSIFRDADEAFFQHLADLKMDDVEIYAVPEGTVVFPRIPLVRVEGPVLKAQLLETTLLTLVNFASLVATNAARFRAATSKPNKTFLEFGLRRAQGPDGGLTASKYCFLGGFDGTSNVLAGKLFDIPVKGTHAHAYVNSYKDLDGLTETELLDQSTKERRPFAPLCVQYLAEIARILNIAVTETNKGELAAFISFAIAFPKNFLALVDTYDVLKSGLPNFLAVARALHDFGYKAIGLRLDSGDLAYLSIQVRKRFELVAEKMALPDYFVKLTIVASNDINEDTLISLEKQNHEIDTFGIGTHLVTCQKQPALGCVYKLVELAGEARIKLSQDVEKVTIPGRKNLYRLFGKDGKALCDLLTKFDEKAPKPTEPMLIQHPFSPQRRANVRPTEVRPLYKLYWADGQEKEELPPLKTIRDYVKEQLDELRDDIRRHLNPTPHKVSLSQSLYSFMQDIWTKNTPIVELQ